ncbi:hypothetical protein SAMN05518672_111146 [Chitinophaga sp. CF118]|nr:hypothetical protein SAMN05518672_111146 [Chitinophaga sp. CF118]
MIGIFCTNISTIQDKNTVIEAILTSFKVIACSIDLEDCDKVLRIVPQHQRIEETIIIEFIQHMGFQCTVLE